MDKTLDKVCLHDKNIRSLLEEMIGYSLYRKSVMQVCFILTGEGSNGKSTILNCIKKLLGKQNYTSLDLRELEETFKPSELYGKLANIGDDISAKYLESSSVFKKCVTGESFIVQRKYGQPFELESYATQIFCANELPQVKDKSDGFARRIVLIPFNARFSKTDVDYDPFIEDKLMSDESINYLLKLAIDGLRRVLENRQFTKSDVGEREKNEYMKDNNNVLQWLDDEPKIENESVNDVYLNYDVWCARNGTHPVKKLNLSKTLKKHGGYISKPKSIEGKTARVYVKENE
jgi:putative DNA primase/helicase